MWQLIQNTINDSYLIYKRRRWFSVRFIQRKRKNMEHLWTVAAYCNCE